MADFTTAIRLTLTHEGGFQKDPKDRANWTSGIVGVGKLVGTKYGLSYDDLQTEDIEHITPEQAIKYYSAHYWKPLYSQITLQALANKLFDMGVLFGIGAAVKSLQFALGVTVDGDFGPKSLLAANERSIIASEAVTLLEEYKKALRYRAEKIAATNPNEAKFLHGWENRINS